MTYELTPGEREQWDVDPDLWPHTPPFHVFAALMDEDDNTWWRAGSGHGLNAYEAAREIVEAVEALHVEVVAWPGSEFSDVTCCQEDRKDWPCATIRALRSDAHTEQKGAG